jgi:hypothetical protein
MATEQKKEAANNVFRMQMGKKEIDSPGTFSTKQSNVMQMSPLLQTKDENGMKVVGSDTTTEEKMVQGLLGQETKTTIDLASDPTTTTIPGGTIDETVYTTGKSLEGLNQEQLDWRTNEIEKLGGIDAYHTKYGSKEKGKARTIQTTTPDQTVETPGETAQKKETEFKPYPFKDTYDPFEARQEGRNIKATQRKLKREKIRESRAQAKIDGKTGKEKREAVKSAKAQAKLDQRKATKKGMEDIATSVSTQVEKGKNPAQTDSYQAKPNNSSATDYKNMFSDAAKRVGNMDTSLGNTDFKMQMKPMQFRNVAYSGKKSGKSGYKK